MASAWHWLAKVRSDVKPAAPHQPCLNRSFVKASLHGSHVACQSCVYPYCLDMCSSSPLGISSVLISTLPAHSPAFFPQNLSRAFPVFAVANTCSCVGPQNKIVHLVYRYRQLMQVPVLSARRIQIGSKTFYFISWFGFRKCGYSLSCGLRKRDVW